jgi:hypothetical protein
MGTAVAKRPGYGDGAWNSLAAVFEAIRVSRPSLHGDVQTLEHELLELSEDLEFQLHGGAGFLSSRCRDNNVTGQPVPSYNYIYIVCTQVCTYIGTTEVLKLFPTLKLFYLYVMDKLFSMFFSSYFYIIISSVCQLF